MTADKLMLNNDKTELIVIGTRFQLDKTGISELSIDYVKVSAVCNVRNLGTWFENHLSERENRHQQDLSIGTLPSA